jgi:hypothetical protein
MEVISISRQPIEGGLDQEHVTFLVKLQDIDKAPIISPNQIEVFEPGGDNSRLIVYLSCYHFDNSFKKK